MEAIIKVEKSESPYKIIRSPWLRDKEGPVLFKLLSKKRLDGKIEAAYVVERNGGRKTILGRTVVEEERFMDAANAFRSVVWKFFPDVNLKIEDIEPINISSPKSTSQYSVAKNTKIGIFWLKIKRWLGM